MAGIYIHIPFCHSKCAYCDFYSTPWQNIMDGYIDALLKEWHMRSHELAQPVTTVYIGGGTPSILTPQLLSKLTAEFASPELEEFTIEANPEDITPEWVAHVVSSGINRVSIGLQSLVDEELRCVGRRHTATQALDAIKLLRDGGITEISADLIYGLPGQTPDTWRYSLDTLIKTRPQHISAYSLSYEEGTRLHARLMAGKIQETDEDIVADMYGYLTRKLHDEGYDHYEISNFAMPGHRARHNSSYWHFVPYLGLGPSAHSFDCTTRRANKADVKGYISAINRGENFYTAEQESHTDLLNDYIITALRTKEGIELTEMEAKFGKATVGRITRRCHPFINTGQLTFNDNHIRFDEAAWLVSDAVLRDLID